MHETSQYHVEVGSSLFLCVQKIIAVLSRTGAQAVLKYYS